MEGHRLQVPWILNCGAGGEWGTWVHSRGETDGNWDESGDPTLYNASTSDHEHDCANDRSRRRQVFSVQLRTMIPAGPLNTSSRVWRS